MVVGACDAAATGYQPVARVELEVDRTTFHAVRDRECKTSELLKGSSGLGHLPCATVACRDEAGPRRGRSETQT